MKECYYIQKFLFLIKSNKKLSSVNWFLFKSRIYKKKLIRIFNLVTLQIDHEKPS